MDAKSLQSCPTLWDPIDCSPPGSSAHGILQARILEWVAISFSRDRIQVSCSGWQILYHCATWLDDIPGVKWGEVGVYTGNGTEWAWGQSTLSRGDRDCS